MPAQQCIYDNFGPCIRTVTDMWYDSPEFGPNPPPSITHLPLWLLCVTIGVFIIFRFLRWAFETLESGPGRLVIIPGFFVSAFVSIVVANIIFDHGMRLSGTVPAFNEAVRQVSTVWGWVANFRT